MFEHFTDKAIKAIMAQEEASPGTQLCRNQILLGLIGEGTGVAAKVLMSWASPFKTHAQR